MATEFEISRTAGKCFVSERDLAEGEAYYAVLIETAEGFERRDYSLEAWSGPPDGSYCHWRTRIPVRDHKPRSLAIDQAMLSDLFVRLEDEDSEMKQRFRFVLALLLMRKRLLKFEQTTRDGEREFWQMRLTRDQSIHQVLNPQLTDDQIDRLSTQLMALLGGEPEAVDALDEPEIDERQVEDAPVPETDESTELN
jgi:hypothetical protein